MLFDSLPSNSSNTNFTCRRLEGTCYSIKYFKKTKQYYLTYDIAILCFYHLLLKLDIYFFNSFCTSSALESQHGQWTCKVTFNRTTLLLAWYAFHNLLMVQHITTAWGSWLSSSTLHLMYREKFPDFLQLLRWRINIEGFGWPRLASSRASTSSQGTSHSIFEGRLSIFSKSWHWFKLNVSAAIVENSTGEDLIVTIMVININKNKNNNTDVY